MDVRTGRTLWSYKKEYTTDLRLCCGKVNRGVAILGNTVITAASDANLIRFGRREPDLR